MPFFEGRGPRSTDSAIVWVTVEAWIRVHIQVFVTGGTRHIWAANARTRGVHAKFVEALHISNQVWQLVGSYPSESSKTLFISRSAPHVLLLVLLHQVECWRHHGRRTMLTLLFLFNGSIWDKWLAVLQVLYTCIFHHLFTLISFLWRRTNPWEVLLLTKWLRGK